MTRRARIRAFLLGLLIGGGSWTAAAHDDASSQSAPGDGVVADCPTETVADSPDRTPEAETEIGATAPDAKPSVTGIMPALSRPRPDPVDGAVEALAFAAGIQATVGPAMSGTPPLGLLSGSS